MRRPIGSRPGLRRVPGKALPPALLLALTLVTASVPDATALAQGTTPTVTVSPTTGPPGSTVSVGATGFSEVGATSIFFTDSSGTTSTLPSSATPGACAPLVAAGVAIGKGMASDGAARRAVRS